MNPLKGGTKKIRDPLFQFYQRIICLEEQSYSILALSEVGTKGLEAQYLNVNKDLNNTDEFNNGKTKKIRNSMQRYENSWVTYIKRLVEYYS